MPTANHAQIFQYATTQHATQAGLTPPNHKSPLKSVYKAMLKQKVGQVESLRQQKLELQLGLDHKDKKISSQNQRIKELASLLQDEKKKSRAVIEKLMMEADAVIAEANEISQNSTAKVSDVCDTLDRSKVRYKDAIRKERQRNHEDVASCKFDSCILRLFILYLSLICNQSLSPITVTNHPQPSPSSKIKT